MKKELERLKELESYHVLNSKTDENLNDLARIAALACNVPISQITFVHEKSTFVKAHIEDQIYIDPKIIKRDHSFCQYSLDKPNEVLVVKDATKDKRFANNPYVTPVANIRFYAGKPLTTKKGNVLGTLCIVDKRPQILTENQKHILNLLAKRVMKYLENKREIYEKQGRIETNAERLKKLTDNLSIGVFQLRKSVDGRIRFEFLNEIMNLHYPNLILNKPISSIQNEFSFIHPEDRNRFINHLNESLNKGTFLNIEFRIDSTNNCSHHLLKGKAEKMEDGNVIFFGSIRCIDDRIEYEKTLEQISFDISHVLRKPISNLLGLNSLIVDEKNLSKKKLLSYIGFIKEVSDEMEEFTRQLNDVYHKKKVLLTNHSNIYKT